jgi:nucleotide-binding universal stress UspA family protein
MNPVVQGTPAAAQAIQNAIRTILVHVVADETAAARLATAVALARKFDAVLLGLAAEMVPPLGMADPTGMMEGAWGVEMNEQVLRRLKLAREVFRQAATGIASVFESAEDMPAPAMALAARGADLIVAGGHPLSETDRYRQCNSAEVMLSSGRPVLVAPPDGGVLEARAVVVGWKDSRESRRALADALPFLAGAESVLVTEVAVRDEADDAELRTQAVVAGLERHGVRAQGRVVVAGHERAAAELNIAAEEIGADLIVAGGYGRTRLGEWVFGGVTRDLLHRPERFVLLSH